MIMSCRIERNRSILTNETLACSSFAQHSARDSFRVTDRMNWRCGMSDELRVKFWGVRGSYPAPGAGTIKYGGNTACVEIHAGERTIVLDAGTGIISLGRELAARHSHEVVLLFSHLHHDHTQ